VPICAYDDSQIGAPEPSVVVQRYAIWGRRFGHVAADGPKGILGVSEGAKTPRHARELAVADCIAQGGDAELCGGEPLLTFENQCAAFAWGPGGAGIGTSVDLGRAETLALDTCVNSGGSECALRYAGCSLPEQTGWSSTPPPILGLPRL